VFPNKSFAFLPIIIGDNDAVDVTSKYKSASIPDDDDGSVSNDREYSVGISL
jgi:hypothetical protein